MRHPVQLYEAATMVLFLAAFVLLLLLLLLRDGYRLATRAGFISLSAPMPGKGSRRSSSSPFAGHSARHRF